MPPLPNTFDDETAQLIAAAHRSSKDIAEFQIPRLRSCTGPLTVQQTLAAELREDIDGFSRHVENLDIMVADQPSEKGRRELRHVVQELQETLVSLRKDSRAALLASKRLIDSQSQSRRDELLRSNAVTEKRDPNEKITEDTLMKANNDVTEALRRTVNLMQGELERSVLSTQMLESSSASLRSTSSTHDTLTNLMGTSKQLITALEKADWLDRLLIFSALGFFVLVVLFIIKQRLVDRGLRIAFWWTRFLPSGSDPSLDVMEKGSDEFESVVASTSSVVASVTSAASVAAASVTSVIAAVSSSAVPTASTSDDAADVTLDAETTDETSASDLKPTPAVPEAVEEVALVVTTATDHPHIEL
ncbi:hypothetical protein HGRIS_011667 [Hohenbuehelia grisea]|uniref:Sec20 C-terminal domain-containing protein n=1 Tax=Hohenbuehelia grisea TaxID=104357 RepID=A0ABR3JY04_9AGAR